MKRNYWTAFGAFLLPFVLALGVICVMVPGLWFRSHTDAPEFLFGTGLDWLTLTPIAYWHMPGYFWSMASAPLAYFFGMSGASIIPFQIAGVVFQYAVMIGCAVYIGRGSCLFPRLLTPPAIALVAWAGATYPCTLNYARIWGHNYPNCVLLSAVAMGMWVALHRRRVRYSWERHGPALAGFCAANFFTCLAIPLVWLAIKFPYGSIGSFKSFRHSKPLFKVYHIIPVILGLWSFTRGLIIYAGTASDILPPSKLQWVLANPGAFAGISMVLVYLIKRGWMAYPPLAIYFIDTVFPMSWGWLIGCGPVFFQWGWSLFGAWTTKGGAPSIPVWHLFTTSYAWGIFSRWNWMAMLLLPMISCLSIYFYRRDVRMRMVSSGNLILFVLVLFSAGGCLAANQMCFFHPSGTFRPGGWGGDLRIEMTFIASVNLAILMLWQAGNWLARSSVAILVILAGAMSFPQYAQSNLPYQYECARSEALFSRLTQEHFSLNPENRVILAGPLVNFDSPAFLTAWNYYQTAASAKIISRRTLQGGRWVWASDWDRAITMAKAGRDWILYNTESLPSSMPASMKGEEITPTVWLVR